MTTLDDNREFIDPTDVPIWNTAIRYGLIGGGIMIAYTLISNLLGMNSMSMVNGAIGIVVSILIYVFVVRSAIKKHRDEELGGFIKLGRAFALGLVACLVTGLITGLFTYLYFNFIDPGSADVMVESMGEMMEGMGLDEDQVALAMEGVKDGFGFGKSMMNGVMGGGIMGAIVSVITGAIMKKEPPMV